MDDVMPFLRNVLKGKNVPESRMLAVAKHYEQFGGISPINEQNRILISALESHFKALNFEMPIYWGNRNWHPMLKDTIEKMSNDGIKNALYFLTSAYGSYSGCRQYRENMEEAIASIDSPPRFEKLRLYFNHPGFIKANADRLKDAIAQFDSSKKDDVLVLFSAHSIPLSMAENCMYEKQLQSTGELIAKELGHQNYKLVFQSRSGPPTQPWLEPDVVDALESEAANGVKDIIVQPIGFISDHMEVIYDLDTEAKDKAKELELNYVRAGTVGVHPEFVNMIYELILEKTDKKEPLYSGNLGLQENQCSTNCCTYSPMRGGR